MPGMSRRVLLAGFIPPQPWLLDPAICAELEHSLWAQWLQPHLPSLTPKDKPVSAESLYQAARIDQASNAQEPVPRWLAHEVWLARYVELAPASSGVLQRHQTGLAGDDSGNSSTTDYALQPVNLRLATDYVALAEAEPQGLQPKEIAALRESIRPLLADYGLAVLQYESDKLTASCPIVVRDHPNEPWLCDLEAASPWAALGRNIEAYLPRSPEHSRSWRRWRQLATEIEMQWFNHPVNADRESAGLAAVNSVWFAGPIPARKSLKKWQDIIEPTGVMQARLGDDPWLWLEQIKLAASQLERTRAHEMSSATFVITGENIALTLGPAGQQPMQRNDRSWLSRLQSVLRIPSTGSVDPPSLTFSKFLQIASQAENMLRE